MTTPAAEPRPKRSRRMIVWLVAVPVVILLLALAAANWKTFHLAYAKHLMRSDDPAKRKKGLHMVMITHLRAGMSLEEVRRVVAPARVTETDIQASFSPPPGRSSEVSVIRWLRVDDADDYYYALQLGFDENYRLRDIAILRRDSLRKVPLGGK